MRALVLLGALGAFACQTTAELSQDDIEKIREAHESLVQATRDADWDRWLTFFSQDAVLLPPGKNPIVGLEAIRSSMTGGAGTQGSVELLEVSGAGDLAYVYGTYTIPVAAGPDSPGRTDRGSMLEVWRRRSDGSWRLTRDMWTLWP